MCKSQGQGAETPSVEVAVNEKRARFDALTPVSVSSAEVRNIPRSGGKFADRIVYWLKSIGVIGNYKNHDTGWDSIAVNKASVKSVVYHGAGPEKTALLQAVPDLIRDGVYLETNLENEKGLTSHIFASKATIDGFPYAIGYVVREDKNGRRYYDHELTNLEDIDSPNQMSAGKASGHRINTGPSANPAGKESVINILKKHLGVNSDVKNIS